MQDGKTKDGQKKVREVEKEGRQGAERKNKTLRWPNKNNSVQIIVN